MKFEYNLAVCITIVPPSKFWILIIFYSLYYNQIIPCNWIKN